MVVKETAAARSEGGQVSVGPSALRSIGGGLEETTHQPYRLTAAEAAELSRCIRGNAINLRSCRRTALSVGDLEQAGHLAAAEALPRFDPCTICAATT